MSSNAPQSDDAQRDLEQRALRNVRGLVDKMEGLEAIDKRHQRKLLVSLVVGGIVFLGVLAGVLWYSERGAATQPVVIDAGKPTRP